MSEVAASRAYRAVRSVCIIGLLGACVLAVALLWRFPSPVAALLVLASGGLTGLAAYLGRPSRGIRAAGPTLLLGSVGFLLLWPELTLRLLDFRHEAGVEFGFPRTIDFTRFAPDPDLFWTYPRGREGINAMGFRDDEVAETKSEGVTRLLFLGDSCTDLGNPNYPSRLERLVNERATGSGARVESVVMAVSGYSSHQGRVALEKFGGHVAPDVVVVYFGWNDHWHAFGEPDADKHASSSSGVLSAVTSLAARSRAFQGLQATVDRFAGRGNHTPADVVRVPPERYRENLRSIAGMADALGARTVFITAPTTWYRLGVSQRHIDGGYVPSAEVALDRHRRYNVVVREVAAETGGLLLDLEREFEDLTNRDGVMLEDGIHFSSQGLDYLADRLQRFFTATGLLPSTGAS